MKNSFYLPLDEAIEFAQAYERAHSAISGDHGFLISYEETTPAGSMGPWMVTITATNHRALMEAIAYIHLEMNDSPAPSAPTQSLDEMDVFSDDEREGDSEIPGEFQNGPASDAEDEEYEDDSEDDEDSEEEDDEEDEDDEEEPEDEEEQVDDTQLVKLKRPNFVQPTGNKNISVTKN